MRDTRSADATRSSTAAIRGQLNERQWQDVRTAARIAREEGVSLKVHGVDVGAPLRQCCKVGGMQEQQHQMLPSGGEVPQPLSKRQQRSQARLLEFQGRKRKQLLGASTRVQRFLKDFRWKRLMDVWTAWKRKQLVQSRLRSLLWRDWTRPLESWSPGDVFDADGACWPFSRRDLYVGGLVAKLCESIGVPRKLGCAPRVSSRAKRARV